jgi:hypothetical protein
MMFPDWDTFTLECMSVFCPENKAMMALMQLESDHHFQDRHNMEAYIHKFKDLVDISGYMDPIAIVLKFHRDLNAMTQDGISKSVTDWSTTLTVGSRPLVDWISITSPTRLSTTPHNTLLQYWQLHHPL